VIVIVAVFAACGSDDSDGSKNSTGGSAGKGGSTGKDGGGGAGGQSGGSGGTAATGGLPDVSCPSDPIDAFTGTGAKPEAYPTFHSLGLYWKPEGGASDNACEVLVRRRGECEFRTQEPLWFDPNDHAGLTERTNEYRGSVVDLLPGTKYEVRLTLGSGATYSFPIET